MEHSIEAVLDRAQEAGGGEHPTVGDLVAALGDASFAPLLLLPALLIVTPLSGIPGLPSVCGLIIATVAIQFVVGRDHIWLPQWIMRRGVERHKLDRSFSFLKRPARFVDQVSRARLSWLSQPPVATISAMLSVVGGLAMIPLEVIPFASSIVGAGISLFALSMVTRDGVATLAGLTVFAIAGGLVFGVI